MSQRGGDAPRPNRPWDAGGPLIRLSLALALAAFLAWPGRASADMAAGWRAYVAEDYAAAEREWRPLAERGSRDAAFGLGMLFEVTDKLEHAASWYDKAARRGLVAAQVLLGAMYAEGRGVPRDLIQAYAWLNLAAAGGQPNAILARDAVAAQMSAAEVAEAEALSWKLVGEP